MEYKFFDAPQVKMTNDGHGIIAGYASTFGNFDSTGERVVKGAFLPSLLDFMNDGFIAVGHDWSALPIATPVEASEDDKGLFVRGEFHSTTDAQEARTVIRERLERGKSVKLSIGYEVLDDDYTQDGRLLKNLKLYEWSYVTVPANSMAAVTDAKGQPRFGLTLDTHVNTALVTVNALKARLTDLLAMRLKDELKYGAALSRARIESLTGLVGALADLQKQLQELINEAQPKADPEKARALFLEFQRIEAQLNGALNA